MHSTIRSSTNLSQDDVLVDSMVCPAIGFIVGELDSSIQCFLLAQKSRVRLGPNTTTTGCVHELRRINNLNLSMHTWCPFMMPFRTGIRP